MVIPTGSALLYAESIYLQADRSPMPELRLVVLALQDRLAYGTTFEAALSSLFNGTESSITSIAQRGNGTTPDSMAAPTPLANPASASRAPAERTAEIRQAAQDLAEYQRLTAEGKLGDAGAKLDSLKRHLNHLSASTD